MYRVTYDYRDEKGFIQTDTIVYDSLKHAFAMIKGLTKNRNTIGKPILERV